MSGFSSKETLSLERKVNVGAEIKLTRTDLLELNYEIDRCVEWIREIKAQKICLQFPDALLGDSVNVALKLEKHIGGKVFILGDTSYGSCCVDEVAAQHVDADAIIHFGKACLSPTNRLPVLYIFEKYEFDVENFVSKVEERFPAESITLILYEVYYSHMIDVVHEKLSSNYANMVFSELATMPRHTSDKSDNKSFKKLGREFNLPEGKNLRDYQIIFIGKDGRTLSNFVMDMDGASFYIYNPEERELKDYEYQKSKFLMRRLYLVEQVKDARTLGIVVGTLGVSNYLEAVDRVKQLAKRSGKKSYIIAVGKPNVPKLANFPEVDVFVLIACSENCLLDSKEFYKPIVTPYDVELALNPKQELGQIYITDFRELLPGGSYYRNIEEMTTCPDDQPTDISLISGRLRNMGPVDTDIDRTEVGSDSGTIALKSDTTLSIASSGSEFLSTRSWQGLEQKLGQTEVSLAVQGRGGIPQNYNSDLDTLKSSVGGKIHKV